MSAEQKRAWLAVVTGIVSLIGFLGLLPFVGPWVATAAFSVFAINGSAPLIGRGQKQDERDVSIARQALLAGGMASYMAFVISCMGVWFVVFAWRGQELISVHVLGTITVVGGAVFYFVRAVAVLALYGRAVEADNA